MMWRAISAWPDPSVLFEALGVELVMQRVAEGDREAQWSLGYWLVSEADGGAVMPLGAASRSSQADVGFEVCTARFPIAHRTDMRRGTFS